MMPNWEQRGTLTGNCVTLVLKDCRLARHLWKLTLTFHLILMSNLCNIYFSVYVQFKSSK